MNAQVEMTVRGPEAYDLAIKAIESMRKYSVWPTPLNFELWLHYIDAPHSPLAKEIQRTLDSGAPFTEITADNLAAKYLPQSRLSEEIRDVGAVLDRELSAVQVAMDKARLVQQQYGQTLSQAAHRLDTPPLGANDLGEMVTVLSEATHRIQRHTGILEKRLQSSHAEVSKLRTHLEQVRRDAMTDALTNLANRKAFDEKFQAMCSDAEENGTSLALAVIDIDHFKRFNDNWGHQTGDQILRYVATALGNMAQKPRFAARYGGEEFAVIFPSEDAGLIENTLEALRQEIASRALRRRSTNDDLGVVTISAGYAVRLPNEAPHELIERADEALYASKKAGRNRISQSKAALSDAA